MAITSVWMDVESQQFDQAASTLLWELLAKPVLLDMSTDTAVVEENEASWLKFLMSMRVDWLSQNTWEVNASPWRICIICPLYIT
ncbi:glutathione S-transferase-like [Fagus crenata]